MAMATLEGQITYINPTLSHIFGEKNPDNAIGQSLLPYYDEIIRTRLVNEIIPTVILEGQWTGELEILTRTGNKTSTIENFFLIRDTNGKPLYLADVVTDITDRKKAREALEYSEAKNTALFNAIPDMMFQLAKDGTFLDFKSGKDIHLLMPHNDFLGKNVAEVLPPKEAQLILHNMDKAFQTREIQRFEYQISLEDNIYNYEARIVVLGDLEALAIVRDITERKLAEDQLKERQQEIESLNSQLEQRVQEELAKSRQKDHILIQQSRMASLGEMIGHIAHQWRQPLNALNILLANIQQAWLFNELNDQFLDDTMDKGKQYIKNMSTTIDDFRNFFRPDKGKEEFSLSHVINDTLSLVESTLNYYNINVKLKKDKNIKITGFPNEYSQVIINLLSNSKDAIVENNIKNGEIRIEILNDEDQVIVRFLDNGGGIPESMIGKVFDPYFSTKDEGKGTGIGLYMSKMIIEDHMEGRIDARNVNGGVEFSIMTPRIQGIH
ncbi:MAG: hypothetical protein IEMM0008_1659 [bacterium]|nr:MAG: hypothetical protein IEMM0008_1659 [bacterium]